MDLRTTLQQNALLFRHQRSTYLYGLTLGFNVSKQIEGLIIPTHPYSLSLKTYFWEVESLRGMQYNKIIFTEAKSRKEFEKHCNAQGVDISTVKWDYLKNIGITEEQLQREIELLHKGTQAPKIIQWEHQKMGVWVSHALQTWGLTHQQEIILVDPCGRIQQFLTTRGISLLSVKAVLLTEPNMNIIELLLKIPRTVIITFEGVFRELRTQLKRILLWSDSMLRDKLEERILSAPEYRYNYRFLSFSFNASFLELSFCSKRIRVYTKLTHFPHEVTEANMSIIMAYHIPSKLQQDISQLPFEYRQIVVELTKMNKSKEKVYWIEGEKRKQAKMGNTLHLIHPLGSPYSTGKVKIIQNKQVFNFASMMVRIVRGTLWNNQTGKQYGIGDCFSTEKALQATVSTTVLYQTAKDYHFMNDYQQQSQSSTEDLLLRVKDNSFLATVLALSKQTQTYFQPKRASWATLSSLCNLVSFQAGGKASLTQKVYFLLRGSVRVIDHQGVAVKNMFVGCVKDYYLGVEGNEMEILKDTTALEIDLTRLHHDFLRHHPACLYDLCCRQCIFE